MSSTQTTTVNRIAAQTQARRPWAHWLWIALVDIWSALAVIALLLMVGARFSGVQFNVVQTASTPA